MEKNKNVLAILVCAFFIFALCQYNINLIMSNIIDGKGLANKIKEEIAVEVAKIRKAGGKIDREATPHYTIEGGLVGLGRDPDNYVVEIIQWQAD